VGLGSSSSQAAGWNTRCTRSDTFDRRCDARAWLLFALSSVIWGVPYFFIKVAVDAGVPPAFVAWARVALGAVLLLPVALRRGALRGLGGRERAWPIAAYAACEIAGPFVLIAAGARYIASRRPA